MCRLQGERDEGGGGKALPEEIWIGRTRERVRCRKKDFRSTVGPLHYDEQEKGESQMDRGGAEWGKRRALTREEGIVSSLYAR